MFHSYVTEEVRTPLKILNYSDAMWAELQSYAWMSLNQLTQLWCKRKMYQHLTPHEHWNPSKLFMHRYKRKSLCSVSKMKSCCKPLLWLGVFISLHVSTTLVLFKKRESIHLFHVSLYYLYCLYTCLCGMRGRSKYQRMEVIFHISKSVSVPLTISLHNIWMTNWSEVMHNNWVSTSRCLGTRIAFKNYFLTQSGVVERCAVESHSPTFLFIHWFYRCT